MPDPGRGDGRSNDSKTPQRESEPWKDKDGLLVQKTLPIRISSFQSNFPLKK